ncbi:MAG TPA: TlpA disulfide reductase family protein, partial [Acidimicrobiales bacterium]
QDTIVVRDSAPAPRRRAPWIALGVAVVLAGVFAALAMASGGSRETARTPLLGQPAPAVQTVDVDGEAFDLGTRRGSWVVLNFFQTQCVPCVQEHPELVKFDAAQRARAGGAELVTVINYDSVERVKAFFSDNGGGTWPVLRDDDGRIYVSFGVAKVPETWIVDPAGVVRARIITTVTAQGLAALIDELAGGSS